MDKRNRTSESLLVSGLSLLLLVAYGLAQAPSRASAHAAFQADDLVGKALALAAAFDNKDASAVRNMLDPAFQDVSHYGPPVQQTQGLDDFVKGTMAGVHVALANCRLSASNVVDCDSVLSGGPLPVLPHPFSETSRFTFANGKVLRIDQYLSAQTARDLPPDQTGPPGAPPASVPATGAADGDLLLASLAAGLLLLTAGVLVRRARRIAH